MCTLVTTDTCKHPYEESLKSSAGKRAGSLACLLAKARLARESFGGFVDLCLNS